MVNHLGIWKNGELGDFVTLKRGFDLPQQKREYGQVPIFSSSGIKVYFGKRCTGNKSEYRSQGDCVST